MSERPTDKPAWRAAEPCSPENDEPKRPAPARYQIGIAPSGESLAVRAERFRNGAPFLVERATLYDPFPLKPLPASASNGLSRPRPMLPAALTLLGVVIVVGLSAAILFVRNTDGPRIDSPDRTARGAPSVAPDKRADPAASRDGIAYDLTKRADDVITGAWRPPKDIETQPPREGSRKQVGPVIIPPPDAPTVTIAPPPDEPRRFLPRRVTVTPFALPPRQVAEPQAPVRAPLDEPHVPKVAVDNEPRPSRSTASDAGPAGKVAAPDTADRAGPNVVARVRRSGDPSDGQGSKGSRRVALPMPPSGEQVEAAAKGGAMSQRGRREQLRRMRDARREAQDVDRFQLRDRGDIPKGFTYSGPQGQRP